VATGSRQRKYLDGDLAPPMFHVPLFWDVVELDQLSPDGVSIDELLPKFPLEKAMAGGLEIEYHKPIHPGDWLTGTRTLTDIYEKEGRSGPLIFYEVVMDIVNDEGDLVIREKTTRILR
jgi:hydroxyacyl-ACP dehydratase HTD2-like protein with hotdog domain